MKISKSYSYCSTDDLSVSKSQHNSAHNTFSDNLTRNDIKKVLIAVADWQINTGLTHHPADWTNAALYAGMVQWAAVSGDDSYYKWLLGKGEQNSWSYKEADNPLNTYHADDYCVGQVYVELYRKYNDEKMIIPVRKHLDDILNNPAKGDLEFVYTDNYWPTQRWAWCDALFMGPTVWAKMANVTRDQEISGFYVQGV